jgi:hypothetical protein
MAFSGRRNRQAIAVFVFLGIFADREEMVDERRSKR